MAEQPYSMNKQRQAHMGGGGIEDTPHKHPHIHIHSHEKGHTVHVMHHDGSHTKTEHPSGDAEGIKSVVDQHIGGGQPVSEGGPTPGEEEEFS